MPEHTTFITYILSKFPALQQNAHNLGTSVLGHEQPTWRSFEPIATSLLIMAIVVLLSLRTRARLADVDAAVIPDDKLTLKSFMEGFVGFFYDMAKDVMGPKRAKRYFPIIGGSAIFVFFSNVIGLVPGLAPPTSSLNITLGCALVVFILFNFYGLQANGLGYIKHLAGPMWWLAPLILPIEVISLCVRPVTLSVRLMVNMAVDHLLGTMFLGIIAVFVPIPLMFLGAIVIVVQTLVFSLLTAIYIGLATEHEEHH
jgi:F-type H+-transporting ATPase subunit a